MEPDGVCRATGQAVGDYLHSRLYKTMTKIRSIMSTKISNAMQQLDIVSVAKSVPLQSSIQQQSDPQLTFILLDDPTHLLDASP